MTIDDKIRVEKLQYETKISASEEILPSDQSRFIKNLNLLILL